MPDPAVPLGDARPQPISDSQLRLLRVAATHEKFMVTGVAVSAVFARLDAAESKLTAAEELKHRASLSIIDYSSKLSAAEAVIEAARRWTQIPKLHHPASGWENAYHDTIRDLEIALAAYDRALSTTPEDAE